MEFLDIFTGKSEKLFWKRLPPKQVVGGYTEKDILNDQAYFIIRLKEMYLRTTRVVLRKYYPMLYSYAKYGGNEVHSVSGPGQLRELGDMNLERLINLNTRLTDITPYKGGDVDLLVGLYAIPGQDAGKVLIDTLSSVANLVGLVVGQTPQIANVVKNGVEKMLGLDQSALQLGIKDTFYPDSNPFRSGHYLGINAPFSKVDLNQLWLSGGQLMQGPDSVVVKPYKDFDYMVLELEHREYRDDWPRLPGMLELNEKFAKVMGDNGQVSQKREQLKNLWPEFQNALSASPFLVQPDRQRIAKSVADDLKARLIAIETGVPFETRDWSDTQKHQLDPKQFDMVDVDDTPFPQDDENHRKAYDALTAPDYNLFEAA